MNPGAISVILGLYTGNPLKEHVESQDNGNRNTEIVRLSEAGMTHTAIGERFGITRQRVSAIVAKQAGQGNARERELRKLYDRQAKRADNPPPKSTATGFNQLDPRTCTCGFKADRHQGP